MLAGVHRARHLTKHLPASGWNPIVLCVDEAYHEEKLDSGLAELVPPAAEIVKVSAIPASISRLIGLGDISLRGFMNLRMKLSRLLTTRSVDIVMITGSPYYPMLLAPTITQRFGVPVVLDLQDPWVSDWGASQRRISKCGLSHALATKLEPHALRGASFVTSVSETQNRQLLGRYPWLNKQRMAAIPIGSDPQEFEAIKSVKNDRWNAMFVPSFIHVTYAGTVWPLVNPTLQVFLKAVAALRRASPQIYARLRLHFVGTTANPNDQTGYRVLPLAEAEGVEDIVHEVPQRLPYLDALSILKRSNVTLMLGSNEPHYTASKIYPYLMSGRPYLSLFHLDSSAHTVLTAAGGGLALSFSTAEDLASKVEVICEGLRNIVVNPNSLGKADPTVYAPFEACASARQFANIFDNLRQNRESDRACA